MTATASLAFRNNQNFILLYGMSEWAGLYDLTKAKFRMQIRVAAGDELSIYAFASFSQSGIRGAITYSAVPQILIVSASYADVRTYFKSGTYAHDLTIEVDDPVSGLPLIIRDAAAGDLTITDGVTLQ